MNFKKLERFFFFKKGKNKAQEYSSLLVFAPCSMCLVPLLKIINNDRFESSFSDCYNHDSGPKCHRIKENIGACLE